MKDNKKAKKIFIIAGEESGDLLGSKIVTEIQKTGNHEFLGISGKNMGVNVPSIFEQSDISLMGFVEVIPAIPRVLNRIKQTVSAISNFKPDIVITIDSPDFSFRVAKKIKKLKLKTKLIHIVAPTVWAYREKRAAKIAKIYDQLLVLFPFEPPYFTKYGLDTEFIGHPLLNKELISANKKSKDNNVLTLTLGSRNKEIKTLAPIYKQVLEKIYEKNKNLTIVIPTFSRYEEFFKEWIGDLKFQKIIITTDEKEKYFYFKNSKLIIAKSGTNTLEIAKCESVFAACYKVNFLTYFMLKLMVKTKFVNLINIMAEKLVVPEFIQYECTAQNIANYANEILANPKKHEAQLKEQNFYLHKFLKCDKMGKNVEPAKIAADKILKN
jgi:lipid-A-disaccharide synthase